MWARDKKLHVELLATYALASFFPADDMERAWTYSVKDALAYFDVDISKGLSGEQVLRSQARYGSNGSYTPDMLINRAERGRVDATVALGLAAVSRSIGDYPSLLGFGVFGFGSRRK